MTIEHTPGPWTDEESDMGMLCIYGRQGQCIATIHHSEGGREQNARLIAAAPCLAKAGSDLISTLEEQLTGDAWEDPDIVKAVDDLREAIKKGGEV